MRNFGASASRGVWRVAVLALLAVSLSALRGRAATVTASLDRDATTVGDSVTLMLVVEGGSPDAPPPPPRVANLAIDYAGQSSQFTFSNGVSSSSVTYNYQVRAARPGTYTIPPITVTIGNAALTSQRLTLRVLTAEQTGGDADPVHKIAFVKLVVPRSEVYLGEVVPVEIQLYAQNGRNLQMPQLHGDGFTVSKVLQPTQTKTQVGNVVFNLLEFKTAATAVKAGTLPLGPAELGLEINFPQPGRRNRDPFSGDPFDIFGDRGQWRAVTLSSEATNLTILPLPTANVPRGFGGAVGKFAWQVSVSPTNVAVGDPITLKIQIVGRGSLDSLAAPSLSDWHDFKVYPPTGKIGQVDPLGIEGTKSFEQVVVPENAEVKELPALTFSYFDPELKSYATLSAPATPLIVRPTASLPAQPAVAENSNPNPDAPAPPTRDIVHIKASLGALTPLRPVLVQQGWFLTLQGLPLAVWLSVAVWRRRAERLANNPRWRRRRQVSQLVRTGLAELRVQAERRQAAEFHATVFRLLQEQLGERLDLPASAITEAALEERLRPGGAPVALIDRLHRLFQSCNQARYAEGGLDHELAELTPEVEAALNELREVELKG